MKINRGKLIQRTKQTGIVLMWLVMVSGVIVSLNLANKKEHEVVCSKVNVRIGPGNELLFIDRETVLKTIRPDGDENKILGQPVVLLNIPLIEQKLGQNKLIRKAEVFTDMNGMLNIHILQRVPVLRIINAKSESYYLDREGNKMPLSPLFTARVPVATGNIFEGYEEGDSVKSFVGSELYKIGTYVDKDAFWKAQIEQIFVNNESELVLVPKVGDHTILFGTSENMEDKFSKLMLFYKEALSRLGWETYSVIDLRFNAQIVCKKKISKNGKFD